MGGYSNGLKKRRTRFSSTVETESFSFVVRAATDLVCAIDQILSADEGIKYQFSAHHFLVMLRLPGFFSMQLEWA